MFRLFRKNKNAAPEYRFADSPDTACFTCDHITDGKHPVLFVSHDEDGCWQFLCGTNSHAETKGKLIGLGEAVKLDSTLNELAEMPKGSCAERKSVGEKWVFYKIAID